MTRPVELLSWAASLCKKQRVRMTRGRQGILAHLAAPPSPVAFQDICQAVEIRGRCAGRTVARALTLFKTIELVRQIGLPKKRRYFVLNALGAVHQYLICQRCGSMGTIPSAQESTELGGAIFFDEGNGEPTPR